MAKMTVERNLKFKETGVPIFQSPDLEGYRCSFCGEEIPNGCSVAALTSDTGNLTGVVASSDSNPFTPPSWLHRCGAGLKKIPVELEHHDNKSEAAKKLRGGH